MSILTKSRLAAVTDGRIGTIAFNSTLESVRNQYKGTAGATIFLSHSHADADQPEVRRVMFLLRSILGNVYIDRNDSGMPVTTGPQTAARLKEKIRECRKFVLVATDNAIRSVWCNWELGYGDAQKFIEHIALLPLSESSGSYTGNEYLNIYPYIEESSITPGNYFVKYPDGTTKNLLTWLSS
jgi:hypothetical protein